MGLVFGSTLLKLKARSLFCWGEGISHHKVRIFVEQFNYGRSTKMKLIDITETFEKDLQDPEFVRFYLEEALNQGYFIFV